MTTDEKLANILAVIDAGTGWARQMRKLIAHRRAALTDTERATVDQKISELLAALPTLDLNGLDPSVE